MKKDKKADQGHVQELPILQWLDLSANCFRVTESFWVNFWKQTVQEDNDDMKKAFHLLRRNEEVRFGEELDERKAQDIFSYTSTQDFMAALRPEADENLSSAQSSLAFVLEEKTIKDFIQTRCHSFSHWSLNQRWRLRFQGHNLQKILWQLNLNMSALWTDWDS